MMKKLHYNLVELRKTRFPKSHSQQALARPRVWAQTWRRESELILGSHSHCWPSGDSVK